MHAAQVREATELADAERRVAEQRAADEKRKAEELAAEKRKAEELAADAKREAEELAAAAKRETQERAIAAKRATEERERRANDALNLLKAQHRLEAATLEERVLEQMSACSETQSVRDLDLRLPDQQVDRMSVCSIQRVQRNVASRALDGNVLETIPKDKFSPNRCDGWNRPSADQRRGVQRYDVRTFEPKMYACHNPASDYVSRTQFGEGSKVPNCHVSQRADTREYPSDIVSLVKHLNRPKPEIVTSNGDPMDYWRFIRNFDS